MTLRPTKPRELHLRLPIDRWVPEGLDRTGPWVLRLQADDRQWDADFVRGSGDQLVVALAPGEVEALRHRAIAPGLITLGWPALGGWSTCQLEVGNWRDDDTLVVRHITDPTVVERRGFDRSAHHIAVEAVAVDGSTDAHVRGHTSVVSGSGFTVRHSPPFITHTRMAVAFFFDDRIITASATSMGGRKHDHETAVRIDQINATDAQFLTTFLWRTKPGV